MPLSVIHFDQLESEISGWQDAKAIFSTPVWRLHQLNGVYFVVGLAFDPPEVFWIGRCGNDFRDITIWADTPCTRRRGVAQQVVIEAVLRTVTRLLITHRLMEESQALLIHAAALYIQGKTYLFPGFSGAGKSTFCKQFIDHPECRIVNDDRMLVRGDGDHWTAWGTPWPGELQIALNQHAPLGGLYFLGKSTRTHVQPLTTQQALERLLPVVSIPWYDAGLVARGLDLCARLVAEVPVYELHFSPNETEIETVLELGTCLPS